MIFKILEAITGYFKDKPYWSKLEPFFVLLSLYLMTIVLAYQYTEWQYHFSLRLSLFLSSYIVKQITLVYLAIGIIGFLFSFMGKWEGERAQSPAGEFIRKYSKMFLKRVAILGLVMVVLVPIFIYFSPRHVSHIKIKFLKEPGADFDKYALVYLIYELNKLQKNWYFDVDFKVFNRNALTDREEKQCANEKNRSLCYAEIISGGKPFIGITTEQLGEDFFWQNHDQVSVVSTYGWRELAPPSAYEFLVYSIIVNSIVIHLNAHCKGLPEGSFKESRVSHGDLFQFSPDRAEIRAAILSAHLSRNGEELLFNCFGAEYMNICSNLLSLEWLHSKKVTENLEKAFGVKL